MREKIITNIPRLLSLLDRNKFSPTYGCFDRSYWHYKVVDFPAATYQQGVLVLALLYKNQFSENLYYKNNKILDYISAGMLFWANIQNKDGSFNEWYPNERSFVATAFTSYALSEAYLILKDEFSNKDKLKDIVENALKKTGKWLLEKDDKNVFNHTAGAIAGLYNIYLITGENRFKSAAEDKVKLISEYQNEEGWFYEYGGADIGYLTVSLDYLAKYFQKSNDLKIKEILKKALDFMGFFVHPDGTMGGEYGSRNTKYILPHGLTILAGQFEAAGYILSKFHQSLENRRTVIPSTVDDRYFVFFYMSNFLQASLKKYNQPKQEQEEECLPFSKFNHVFSRSGLITVKNQWFHILSNFKKGGIMQIFNVQSDNPHLVYSDSGYFAKLKNGKIITSGWLNSDTCFLGKENSPFKIKFSTGFVYVKYRFFSASKFIFFRLFNYILGRNSYFGSLFNEYIKKIIITKKKKIPLKLEREIIIENNEIIIKDKISKEKNTYFFEELNITDCLTSMHSPTSLYFVPNDLINNSLTAFNFAELLNNNDWFYLEIRLIFEDNLVNIKYVLNGNEILTQKSN
ncbi:hypothetical protein KAU39_03620 [bacterium]|nr:hypothetical protein [bacterium]